MRLARPSELEVSTKKNIQASPLLKNFWHYGQLRFANAVHLPQISSSLTGKFSRCGFQEYFGDLSATAFEWHTITPRDCGRAFEVGRPRGIGPVIFALKDKKASIRCVVAKGLLVVNDRKAVESCIQMRRASVPLARPAGETLGHLGNPMVRSTGARWRGAPGSGWRWTTPKKTLRWEEKIFFMVRRLFPPAIFLTLRMRRRFRRRACFCRRRARVPRRRGGRRK